MEEYTLQHKASGAVFFVLSLDSPILLANAESGELVSVPTIEALTQTYEFNGLLEDSAN